MVLKEHSFKFFSCHHDHLGSADLPCLYTSCGMHGVHCVCCKRGYFRYPAFGNSEETGEQVDEDGFQNVDLIVPEPEPESSVVYKYVNMIIKSVHGLNC
jgi:hypothetical protein